MKKENQLLIEYIIKLLGAGYRVFVGQHLQDLRKVTYCTFAKGDRLGYCQVNAFGIGLDFTTVHVPSRENGTGLASHKEVLSPNLGHAKDTVDGYNTVGRWAGTVKKYKSVEDYLKRETHPPREVFIQDFKALGNG